MFTQKVPPEPTRRERLLESALELFAERGYAGTSVKAIAERAGVSQGLLYVHFADKQALLAALFAKGMSDVRSTLVSDTADSALSGVGRLAALLDKTYELVRTNRPFWQLFYTLRFQTAALEALGSTLQTGLAALRDELESVCKDLNLPEPELEARLLFATIDGVCQHATVEPDYPFEEVFEHLLSTYQEVPS